MRSTETNNELKSSQMDANSKFRRVIRKAYLSGPDAVIYLQSRRGKIMSNNFQAFPSARPNNEGRAVVLERKRVLLRNHSHRRLHFRFLLLVDDLDRPAQPLADGGLAREGDRVAVAVFLRHVVDVLVVGEDTVGAVNALASNVEARQIYVFSVDLTNRV